MLAREPFLKNGHEDVNRDHDPDLRRHRVGRDAEESLDPKVLLDPLEEKFDLPNRVRAKSRVSATMTIKYSFIYLA